MWLYSDPSDLDRVLPEDLLDDEVWSRLGRVLQLKPKERVEGKPMPFNSSIVSSLGLGNYKSRSHLPKGPEGVAKQAAQKEAADARKKKKAKVAHWKYKKEKEIARRVKAGERKSDVESELESVDPTDVDDMVFSEEEEIREVVVTSVERRDPTTMSASDEQEAARRAVASAVRKRTASANAIGERAAKRTRSPCPLVASSVPSPLVADAAEQAGRSEEQTGTCASLGQVTTRDSQPGEAPPALDAVEQAEWSKEQTSARALCDS
ncbi:protein gar2-like [Miscanthus floridulus]|uniref:protein gar2-like n=1 Tax=Miscanthus floridulus TaxID=154761 RepID=UPI003458AC7E